MKTTKRINVTVAAIVAAAIVGTATSCAPVPLGASKTCDICPSRDAEISNLEEQLQEAKAEIAELKAQLGVDDTTDTTDTEAKPPQSTFEHKDLQGLTLTNDLPWSENGLTVTDVREDGKGGLELVVKNNTNKSIDSLSNISYKIYDSDGIVAHSGSAFLENLDAGESCIAEISSHRLRGMAKLTFVDTKVWT
ncbi:MAG: hypothetical protein FWG45_04315 [Oscillospiraceae bacterium]|nr:hypothetical protein [Oscillospiraceae bacterium]